MAANIVLSESYRKGEHDVLNFVVYQSTTVTGDDEVLQHKLAGAEMAHVTLHPDGTINLRIKRDASYLKRFIGDGLLGFEPQPSERLKTFIGKVKDKI